MCPVPCPQQCGVCALNQRTGQRCGVWACTAYRPALVGKWGCASMQGCCSDAPLLLCQRLTLGPAACLLPPQAGLLVCQRLGLNPEPDTLSTAACLQVLWEETNGDAIITTGVGQHQMWAAQWYKYTEPRRWVPLCLMWPGMAACQGSSKSAAGRQLALTGALMPTAALMHQRPRDCRQKGSALAHRAGAAHFERGYRRLLRLLQACLQVPTAVPSAARHARLWWPGCTCA